MRWETFLLSFLWALELEGHAAYLDTPLFWVGSAEFKKEIGLPVSRDRFSALELQSTLKNQIETKFQENWKALGASLDEFLKLKNEASPSERAYETRFHELKKQGKRPSDIGTILEQEFPLNQRLHAAGTLFKVLPSRAKSGDWLPLRAITLKSYSTASNSLQLIGNFTRFSDPQFEEIRNAYLKAKQAAANHQNFKLEIENLSNTLFNSYLTLAGKTVQQAHGKRLSYPSAMQLKPRHFM